MLKYTFLIQTGLIVFVFFWSLINSLFQVEVFEAIQHILSRTGQSSYRSDSDESRRVEIPRRVNVLLNTVIEFNCKQE